MTFIKCTSAAVTAISLSLAGLVFAAPTSDARSQSGSPSPTTVTGQVSAVEGEFHMAKDARGEDTLKMVDKAYTITTPGARRSSCSSRARPKSPLERIPAIESRRKSRRKVRLSRSS